MERREGQEVRHDRDLGFRHAKPVLEPRPVEEQPLEEHAESLVDRRVGGGGRVAGRDPPASLAQRRRIGHVPAGVGQFARGLGAQVGRHALRQLRQVAALEPACIPSAAQDVGEIRLGRVAELDVNEGQVAAQRGEVDRLRLEEKRLSLDDDLVQVVRRGRLV